MASNLLARASSAREAVAGGLPHPRGTRQAAPELRTLEPGILALIPGGPVDEYRIDRLDGPCDRALSQSSPVPVGLVVDLSGTPGLDAAGIGFLAALHKRARAKGIELAIAGAREEDLAYLRTLGFDGYFTVAEDLAAALRYLRGLAAFDSGSTGSDGLLADCPACGSALRPRGAGRTRCPTCGAAIAVAPDGEITLG